MMGFLFFCRAVDVLGVPDAVAREKVRCLLGREEGLIPKGFDDGPDETYAMDLGSGGGDGLYLGSRDVDDVRLD
jgi:hypothetical protein